MIDVLQFFSMSSVVRDMIDRYLTCFSCPGLLQVLHISVLVCSFNINRGSVTAKVF